MRKATELIGKAGSLPMLVERFGKENLLMGIVRNGNVFVERVEKGDGAFGKSWKGKRASGDRLGKGAGKEGSGCGEF